MEARNNCSQFIFRVSLYFCSYYIQDLFYSYSSIVQSHETIVSLLAQQQSLNLSFSSITVVVTELIESTNFDKNMIANFSDTSKTNYLL